eukprot:3399428-Pyramimonas_sp.AAC.1
MLDTRTEQRLQDVSPEFPPFTPVFPPRHLELLLRTLTTPPLPPHLQGLLTGRDALLRNLRGEIDIAGGVSNLLARLPDLLAYLRG